MKKPKFIKRLEKLDGIFSSVKLPIQQNDFINFIGKKLESVYEEQTVYDVTKLEFQCHEIIYKSSQQFYIYLSITSDGWVVVVYYKPKQLDELKIFLTQLIKQYKNATINNS